MLVTCSPDIHYNIQYILMLGYVLAQSVEALRYKQEGCRFNSWWCHWNYSL